MSIDFCFTLIIGAFLSVFIIILMGKQEGSDDD